MKLLKFAAAFFLMFGISVFSTPKAHAILITYDVCDHPGWNGLYGGGGGFFPWVSGQGFVGFQIQSMTALFDTDAGTGVYSGTLQHAATDEPWFVNMTVSDIMAVNYNPSQPLPNANMFDELLSLDSYHAMIKFQNVVIDLTPLIPNPAYQSLTHFEETMATGIHEYTISLAFQNILEQHGWFTGGGDFHFLLKNPRVPSETPNVPEPATVFLLGTGLLAGISRTLFRKKA